MITQEFETQEFETQEFETQEFETQNYRNSWYCDACDGDDESGCLSSTGECYR